ncbi:thiol reductant ABC exporter subunit CydD [Aquicoccus sp.]|uniref:thiol reductant ABC exporter subunit CydD n=1 Tax=Aquicoccus sp. TaxID=2055851 RepID=UPI003566819A
MTDTARNIGKSDPAAHHLREMCGRDAAQLRRGEGLWLLPPLLWIGQSAVVAAIFATLLQGTPGLPWLIVMTGLFLLIGLVRVGLETHAADRLTRLARAGVRRLRDDLVERETRRAPHDPARPDSAALAVLLAEKLDHLVPYITRYRPAMLRVMVVPLTILVLAFWLSWAVGLVLLISGPLIPVFQALVGLAARDASVRQMAEIGTLNSALLDRLRGLVDIRLLGATERMVAGFRDRAEALRASTMAVLRVAFLTSAVLELFAALGVAMVAVYVGFSLLELIDFGYWQNPLTVGEGIFLLLLAPAFFEPMRELAAAWHDKAAALAVADEHRALQARPLRPLPGTGGAADRLTGAPAIRTRGLMVDHGAPLRFPDLDIAAGDSLAITGPSGSGKTMLLSLLAGLSAPDAGEIEVAGRPLDDTTTDGWRARLAWVPQGVHFLSGSLRHNLAPGATAEELADALGRAHAQAVVQRLPRGLDTRLGELGTGVSGGEARRLMLARAIHAAPDVLIADEPTADLDPETAQEVTQQLLALSQQGVTLIIATHDMRLANRMTHRLELPPFGEEAG